GAGGSEKARSRTMSERVSSAPSRKNCAPSRAPAAYASGNAICGPSPPNASTRIDTIAFEIITCGDDGVKVRVRRSYCRSKNASGDLPSLTLQLCGKCGHTHLAVRVH